MPIPAPRRQGSWSCCLGDNGSISGEITVTATRWKSNPPTDTSAPISVTYSVLMQDSKRMAIDPMDNIEVEPPTRAEIAAFPKD